MRRLHIAALAAFLLSLGVGLGTAHAVDNCTPTHQSSWIACDIPTRVFTFNAWVYCASDGIGSCGWLDQVIVLRNTPLNGWTKIYDKTYSRNGVCNGPIDKAAFTYTAAGPGQYRAILNIKRENGIGFYGLTHDVTIP